MNILDSELYQKELIEMSELNLPWEKLKGKSFLISGATGLIGSFFIDFLMYLNESVDLNCVIYAMGRSEEKLNSRFSSHINNKHFFKVIHDINKPLSLDNKNIDFVLHLASNTHPVAYATLPIETITTNVIGTNNMLQFAVEHNCKRFIFASSNEIYGENKGDVEFFSEDYCGYIDSNTLRAGYPESKRCGEALCQAYLKQKNLDVVIPRFTRSYGPTMQMSDTKAMSQFLTKGLNGEDIILKSKGTQYYSYTYVFDAVSGLLTVLLLGKKGEAYNIADAKSDIQLKDLAKVIADYANTKVVFELPNEVEAQGFSKATKARLNGDKIKELGWDLKYDIKSGVENTLKILKFIK